MPSAKEYQPENREIRDAARVELERRQKLHSRNMAYYRGDHNKPLKIESGVDDNVILNLCGQAVDSTVAFMGKFPTISTQDTVLDELLKMMFNQKGRDASVFLRELGLSGAVDGQVFVRVVPPMQGDMQFRFVVLDASKVIKFVAADDVERVLWYEVYWKEGKTERRQDVVRNGQTWAFIEYAKTGSTWQRQAEIVWNYPLSPLVDWQHSPKTGEQYGDHELNHAELNDKVNKIASDINKIIRFHASPKTIGLGFEASTIQATAIDDMWVIPDAASQVFNLEMQSDLPAARAFLDTLIKEFFNQSKVYKRQNGQAAATATERILDYSEMLAKNDVLREQYGKGIKELAKRVLMLMGRDFNMPIMLEWEPALPTDEQAQLNKAMTLLNAGLLSKRSAAEMMGIDWEQEQVYMAEEQEADVLQFQNQSAILAQRPEMQMLGMAV